ncbi:MAG: glycosyltransferase family 4 protein, partial [Chloroflexi bacterium]|nr:glycosyltransferase family 4 protein [Chloroflexota bacterium]
MTTRVAIDYTAGAWQGAGIGRYTRELVRHIMQRAPADYQFVLVYAAGWPGTRIPYQSEIDALCTLRPTTRVVAIPLPARRLTQFWHRLKVPLRVEWLTGPIDIVHAPDFVLPPTAKPGLVTIHDLSYLVHPECAVPGVARYLREAVPPSIARADAIFADSVATKNDVVHLLGVDAAAVEVVYAAVSSRFQPMDDTAIAPIRQKYDLPARFVLAGGTLEPRKNYVRLFEAYARARHVRNDVPPLVVFGRRGWMYEEIIAAPARLGVADQIRFVDFIDDNDLPALYNLAWAFVYPSIYEGFGLPPLEALACGTPTLVSNVSSLPEVVGTAAVQVAPDDIPAMATGLLRLFFDDDLRAMLRQAGPVQAKIFTWEAAAQQVLRQYAHLRTSR